MNGDGDAIIANADGLGSFQKEPNFHGHLKKEQPGQILGHFDILVSNPPFSISGFKKDLQNEKDFALAEKVTSKSSEIECLFLERAFQLLKDDGYLGIILPLSILNNESSVYSSARRILFFCFEVIAVVELRDKTFKPTNTATTALFARKRNTDAITGSIKALRNLSEIKAKVKLADISSKTQIPAEHIQESITNDASILETMTSDFTTNGLLKINSLTYRVLLQIIEQNRSVYLGYAGEKKDQEDFLGYRFSKFRGQEGIDILKTDSGEIATKLFSSKGEEDKSKLDYYIRNAFLGKEPEIDESIAPNLTRVTFLEIIGKSATLVMDNPSKFFASRHLSVESNSPFGDFIDNYDQIEISLSQLRKSGDLFYTTGLTYSKQSEEVPYQTQNRVLTASNLSLEKARVDLNEKLLYLRDEFTVPNEFLPRLGDIIISNSSGSLKHLGKVVWVDENLDNYVVGGFLGIFRFRDSDLAKAVFYRLLSEKFRAFVAGLKGQNINNLDVDKIDDFGLTVPRNLREFVKDASDREKELEKINEALAKIK